MKYYRVKKESDNVRVGEKHFLVQNELYTENEKERFKIPMRHLVEVDVKMNKTYIVFGARFSEDCGFWD